MITFLIQVIHFITSLQGSHSGQGESIPISNQNSQTSKEIEVDISVFLGYSVSYCRIVKHSCDFVAVSFFSFQYFVTLIVNYVVFPMQASHTMSSYLGNSRMYFLCFEKCPHVILTQPPQVPTKHMH